MVMVFSSTYMDMNIDNKINLVLGFSLNLTMLVEPTTSNIRHFTFKI